MDTQQTRLQGVTSMRNRLETLQFNNRILASLTELEYPSLFSELRLVNLTLGDIIYSAGDTIQDVYFPETALISLVSTLEDGSTTEVGFIGPEGMVGLPIFLGGLTSPERAVVQISGTAIKLPAAVLARQLKIGSTLQLQLLRYTRAFLALITQSIICSQHHSLEARFARWLLMMHDYSRTDTLLLTHEMVAGMIGTRRAGVSMATRELRRLKLITSTRGEITIIDRPGLESVACECYAVIRDEFEKLKETPKIEFRDVNH